MSKTNATREVVKEAMEAVSKDVKPPRIQKIRLEGFDELFIRDVPIGKVLNKDTIDKYPPVPSGTFISKDRELMVQDSLQRGKYDLICYAADAESIQKFRDLFNTEVVWDNTEKELKYLINKYYENDR